MPRILWRLSGLLLEESEEVVAGHDDVAVKEVTFLPLRLKTATPTCALALRGFGVGFVDGGCEFEAVGVLGFDDDAGDACDVAAVVFAGEAAAFCVGPAVFDEGADDGGFPCGSGLFGCGAGAGDSSAPPWAVCGGLR